MSLNHHPKRQSLRDQGMAKEGDKEGDNNKTLPRKALMTPRQEDEGGGRKKSKPTYWFLETKVKEGRNSVARGNNSSSMKPSKTLGNPLL